MKIYWGILNFIFLVLFFVSVLSGRDLDHSLVLLALGLATRAVERTYIK